MGGAFLDTPETRNKNLINFPNGALLWLGSAESLPVKL